MRRYLYLFAIAVLVIGGFPHRTLAEDQKLEFSGDLRGRWEGFWFQEDPTGHEKSDRRRIRYRLRLDAKATLNEHARAVIRLGSGGVDNRSGNQTLGDPVDFGPNALSIRRAYLTFYPWAKGGLGGREGHLSFQFGRVGIPFIWKNGKDIMLLDNDLNPAGVSANFDILAGGSTLFFVNAGGFVIDEKSSAVEPYFTGLQAGLENTFSQTIKAGIRGSWYYFGNLDTLFLQRGIDGEGGVTDAGGNVPGGLTGDPVGGRLAVLETQVFVGFHKSENWPVTAFGGFSSNLDAAAVDTLGADKEGIAYNAGIVLGDKKKMLKIGVAYYHIEANAYPSQFIDSDLLDGHTNRQGPLVYFQKRVMANTDFNVQLFNSRAIDKDAGFEDSVENSKRTRIQVDLVYVF